MNKVDFLIVGQGLAGTMLAFEMLEQNLDFRIINSPVKSKASLVAAGMINPLVFKRLTKSWMVDELLPVMEKRYKHLEYLLGERFFFQKDILKPLSEQEIKTWKEKQWWPEFEKYLGDIQLECDVEGISKAYAYGIVKGAGYLQLAGFLESAENYFKKHGLLIEADLPTDNFSVTNSLFEIEDISSDKIVFCEGYHLYKNPLFRFVEMKPAKGEVLLIHAPNLSEEFILNKRVFVLPVGSHRFKVGSTYEWEDLSENPTNVGRESIIERLEDLMIRVDYTVEEHWAGVRPTVLDRRPVLGRHPEYPNIFVFNGLGTKGVMLAPKFASQMAHLLVHNTVIFPDEVNVARFHSDNRADGLIL